MALMTMVARVVDGLPLVGSMQEDEQVIVTLRQPRQSQRQIVSIHNSFPNFFFQSGKSILEYQNQAKMLFRKLGPHSPQRCSIETGPYLFQ